MLTQRIFSRSLGTATRGPRLRDIGGQFNHAVDFFTKPALSYSDFHQRCSSLRVFVFWGVIGAIAVDFIVNPPRSSYWTEWAPWRWPVHVVRAFTRPADSLFLRPQPERSINVPEAFASLINNRRMPNEEAKDAYAAAAGSHGHH
jgi:hypothetical protein